VKKKKGRHKNEDDPTLWQNVLFREFQRKYRKVLETRYECRHCNGPVSEVMQFRCHPEPSISTQTPGTLSSGTLSCGTFTPSGDAAGAVDGFVKATTGGACPLVSFDAG